MGAKKKCKGFPGSYVCICCSRFEFEHDVRLVDALNIDAKTEDEYCKYFDDIF